MSQLTDPQSELNIRDVLLGSGYPHITITGPTRQLAYECCISYEVCTKRLAALDDIRKGLTTVKASGITILDLLGRYPALEGIVFPTPSNKVNVTSLRCHLQYEDEGNDESMAAKKFFEQFLDELNERGTSVHSHNYIVTLIISGKDTLLNCGIQCILKYFHC